jgi:hypothetical protein
VWRRILRASVLIAEDVFQSFRLALLTRSHALRGNALPDAPRRKSSNQYCFFTCASRTQSVQQLRSHAEHGNEGISCRVR